ncbi:hypothetical protein PROFUN_01489 [Planoprotostelium fungivorum]|uniref:Uncharacterized protein n=1 Tax=Planoprotostelium fungivorum TaxID=1890364 RepID=A0A2P6NTC7_9EUKA|nr:hypothetical protein PROFUN_01489 [Planoprotostelium fungivorum]
MKTESIFGSFRQTKRWNSITALLRENKVMLGRWLSPVDLSKGSFELSDEKPTVVPEAWLRDGMAIPGKIMKSKSKTMVEFDLNDAEVQSGIVNWYNWHKKNGSKISDKAFGHEYVTLQKKSYVWEAEDTSEEEETAEDSPKRRKTTPKKTPTKETTPKKADSKKTTPKKTPTKETTPKKTPTKETTPKKTTPKKTTSKKN